MARSLFQRKYFIRVITILMILTLSLSACQSAASTSVLSIPTSVPETRPTELIPPTQAPTEPPTAELTKVILVNSVTVSDQAIVDGKVKIAEAVINGVGWLAIHADADGKPGAIIGIAQLQGGENNDILVIVDTSMATDTLYAMLHKDIGNSGMWDSSEDVPILVDGDPVMAPFMITGGLAEEATPTTEVSSGDVTITIADSSFTPNKITIKVGAKVTWMHEGRRYHTVTADDGSFNSGQLAGGESFSFTFTQSGTYAYYCDIHGGSGGRGMSGVIEVTE